MALRECPECKQQISSRARSCPVCGKPFTTSIRITELLGFLICAAGVVAAVIGVKVKASLLLQQMDDHPEAVYGLVSAEHATTYGAVTALAGLIIFITGRFTDG